MITPGHRTFRAMFISDVHLGTRGCRAEQLLDFLRRHDAETIYLVGDIIDGWQLRCGWHWPQSHNDVVQKLLRKARKGARLVYVPGNHDDFLRGYYGRHFGGVEVMADAVHVAADGRRYMVMHGDQFDLVVKNARWLAFLGDHAYTFALTVNTALNWFRRRLGLPYWSISKWAKARVKEAVSYIGEFEKTLSTEASRNRADGVICGHIHHAVVRRISETLYVNCGDWVESCSAAVEHFNGEFEIVTWTSVASQDVEDAASMEAQAA
jgi:UDP-2,3-diacylglucosamine pyrophosphatase LpxH